MLVVARSLITESDAEIDPLAGPCEPGWVHCKPGDVGVVQSVYPFQEGNPDVHFFNSGTTTLCFVYELVPVLAEG